MFSLVCVIRNSIRVVWYFYHPLFPFLSHVSLPVFPVACPISFYLCLVLAHTGEGGDCAELGYSLSLIHSRQLAACSSTARLGSSSTNLRAMLTPLNSSSQTFRDENKPRMMHFFILFLPSLSCETLVQHTQVQFCQWCLKLRPHTRLFFYRWQTWAEPNAYVV